MADKTEEFLQKLAPYTDREYLYDCVFILSQFDALIVGEAARMAREMGIASEELLELSSKKWKERKYELAYVLSLASAQGIEGIKKAHAYCNAGVAAHSMGKEWTDFRFRNLEMLDKAEEHFKKAIKINPKLEGVHYKYAMLLHKLDRKSEAEKHYKFEIESNPKDALAHVYYAKLLEELDRNSEAEHHYKLAIEANMKNAGVHGAYGMMLIDFKKRKDAWKEIEIASNLFIERGKIAESHFFKAIFYRKYSEKSLKRKKYLESSEDADKAGEEFLKAAETAEGDVKDNLVLQGNILKAKSFVRKIPARSWYKKIYYRFGKNPYISELINNLRNAAIYYGKASLCSIDEKRDVCNACHSAVSVFSEVLYAMSAFIKGDSAEINKDKWSSSLELASEIYNEKKLNNGVALVDTLKQLIKCVDELAEHRKIGLFIQEERLGKCYNYLIDVSEKLDGTLKIIAEHAVDAINDYAEKQGMGFVGEEIKPRKSFFDNWLVKATVGAIVAIILGIIANRLFAWNLDLKIWNVIKSFFS